MPTENPRITITMSEEQLEEIRNYLHEHRLKNQTQAILSLINKGFEALNTGSSGAVSNKKAPANVANALEKRLVENFNRLNKDGQSMLCELSQVLADSKRYCKPVEVAARGGHQVDANHVDNLDDLLPPDAIHE